MHVDLRRARGFAERPACAPRTALRPQDAQSRLAYLQAHLWQFFNAVQVKRTLLKLDIFTPFSNYDLNKVSIRSVLSLGDTRALTTPVSI